MTGPDTETDTPPIAPEPTGGPGNDGAASGPSGPSLTRQDLEEVIASLNTGQGQQGNADLSALQNAIDSLPDRIVDAIREAGKPKAQDKAPAAKAESVHPGGEVKTVKGPRNLRSMWFGEQ